MLFYQLLKTENAQLLLGDDRRYSKLKHTIEDLSTYPITKSTERLSKMCSLLSNLLTDLALTKVFIVFDRVDRIKGGVENFLHHLLELIEKTKCLLKILITIRTVHGFDDSLLRENMSTEAYRRVNFDQD